MSEEESIEFENVHAAYFSKAGTTMGYRYWQRVEVGSNFILSAFGSLLYLIGSIFYIPVENAIVLGTKFFIVGSAVIFISQFWKLYRQGCTNNVDPQDKEFRFVNFENDLAALSVDLCAGLGSCVFPPLINL